MNLTIICEKSVKFHDDIRGEQVIKIADLSNEEAKKESIKTYLECSKFSLDSFTKIFYPFWHKQHADNIFSLQVDPYFLYDRENFLYDQIIDFIDNNITFEIKNENDNEYEVSFPYVEIETFLKDANDCYYEHKRSQIVADKVAWLGRISERFGICVIGNVAKNQEYFKSLRSKECDIEEERREKIDNMLLKVGERKYHPVVNFVESFFMRV